MAYQYAIFSHARLPQRPYMGRSLFSPHPKASKFNSPQQLLVEYASLIHSFRCVLYMSLQVC